jgi:hypothetical protein
MDLAGALEKIAVLEGEVTQLRALVALLEENSLITTEQAPIDSSPQNIRRKLWFDFCLRYKVGLPPVPLFFVSKGNRVKTIDLGRSKQPVLQRSAGMETLFLREVGKLIDDYEKKTRKYEGLIYMMYKFSHGKPAPLYIGKAETFGKQGDNLSANLKGINARTSHPFARWGYNYAYHLGDLSAALLNHSNVTPTIKYTNWAKALFKEPVSKLVLKEPIYIWAQAWSKSPISVLPQLGPVKLSFLEYILIGIASAEFPELLNEEGTNRE